MRDPGPPVAAPGAERRQSGNNRLSRSIAGYRTQADHLRKEFDAIDPGRVLAPVLAMIPERATILDVGAGTGAMAAWLEARGHKVWAVDPVAELRTSHDRWHTAALPDLQGVPGGQDVILMSAVWHHLCPTDRLAAWPRLAELCAVGGLVLMSLRHGPAPADRPSYKIDTDTEVAEAGKIGFAEAARHDQASIQAANIAAGVHWTWLALRHVGLET